ncbi:hypothetical protein F4813DRAFT_245039 [Daldinia decipiens]|uniref:uncharacterized protein n=1 Tax=Daldinia decipiens TaxID=326647 RepID=UPI0020C41811|nr:uncharacterized protein F4813DRAFT_245039 [Daldinia decipiens]KAI1653762.1 hypothetical protein F4813DRAFT_245039 [Daldinia decipiens]
MRIAACFRFDVHYVHYSNQLPGCEAKWLRLLIAMAIVSNVVAYWVRYVLYIFIDLSLFSVNLLHFLLFLSSSFLTINIQ